MRDSKGIDSNLPQILLRKPSRQSRTHEPPIEASELEHGQRKALNLKVESTTNHENVLKGFPVGSLALGLRRCLAWPLCNSIHTAG